MRLLLLLIGVFLVFVISCDRKIDSFTDPRDGKVYQTIVIGNQEWMAENLAYTPSRGNFWAYDNNNANVEIYGYLYSWENALIVCPSGWKLPSNEEWTELTNFLTGHGGAGGKLKATGTIETGTCPWYDPNTGATNETGFSALPGGYRHPTYSDRFYQMYEYGYWWSANKHHYFTMYYRGSSVSRNYGGVSMAGFSVRCVRDVVRTEDD